MSEAVVVKESQSPQTPKTKKLVQGKLFFKSPSTTKKSNETKVAQEPRPTEVVTLEDDDPEKEEEKLTDSTNSSVSEDEDSESSAGSPEESEQNDAENINNDEIKESTTNTPPSSTQSSKKTPKQLAREEERKRRVEEKLKEKEEKERKKAEEKEEKERKKAEEKEERERKKAEEKAEREKAKKEKLEEKLKQKQAEKEAKAEEKRRKEEAKEAERKKKEEEKLKAEEEERKKLEKTAQVFTSFFTPKRAAVKSSEPARPASNNLAFVPFQVKENMRLAPLVRTDFTASRREVLDGALRKNGESSKTTKNYLSNVKTGPTGKSGPTWPVDQQQPDVEVIDDEEEAANDKENIIMTNATAEEKKQKAKLLQFHENRRPPYWGTWRKKSGTVTPRRPFAKDAALFDYEVDSDDEWEEEEPGESLTDSEGEEKEPNNEDDYEVDNEFFVPHGYLSDEEGQDEGEERALSPSVAKERLKLKEEEFEQELKKKMTQLKPSLIGCIWQDDDQPQLLKVLQQYAAIVCTTTPIGVLPEENDLLDTSICSVEDSGKAEKTKRRVQDKDMPDLICMVHGSAHGRAALVQEFLQHLGRTSGQNVLPSKAQVSLKIQEIALYTKCSQPGPMNGKMCWAVKAEVLQRYQLDSLSIVNTWQFSSDPKKRGRKPDESKLDEENASKQVDGMEASRPRVSLITKFTQSETPQQAKKRVTLMPVTPTAAKKPKVESSASPLANFLQRFKNGDDKNATSNEDDCVILD